MSAGPLPHETPRLRLRRLAASDLRRFQAYRGDAELGRYQGWQAQDAAAALAFLQATAAASFCSAGEWFQLAIAERASDALIGDIGLHLHADTGVAEIGFTLARDAQGRGLALEAVQAAIALLWAHTPAQRVLGITDQRNQPSVRLLQRAGLRPYAMLDTVFRGQACVEQFFVLHRRAAPAPLLRAAADADALAVAQVLIESRRVLMPFAPSAHTDDDVRDWVRRVLIPGGGVTLAQQGERVVGVLAVSTVAGVGWIDQLYVLPTEVARGIGRCLLAHALASLPRPLQLYTFQANHHARAFYERQDFVAVAFGDGSGNEEHCPDVLYRLDAPAAAPGPALRSPA